MDRQRARELFSDYIEGALPQREREQLERYVESDPSANADLEAFRTTLTTLSNLPTPEPTPRFTKEVEQRIRLRSRGRFFPPRLPISLPFEWFSFVIIILLLTLYLFMSFELHVVVPETAPETSSHPHK